MSRLHICRRDVLSLTRSIGWTYTEEGKLDLSTEFIFDRLSPENPNIAIFKVEKIADEYKDDVRAALFGAGVKFDENFYQPPHTVSIRRYSNDTELPNYSIDLETWEVSCDWKGLFTAFWYEEKLVNTLDHGYVS